MGALVSGFLLDKLKEPHEHRAVDRRVLDGKVKLDLGKGSGHVRVEDVGDLPDQLGLRAGPKPTVLDEPEVAVLDHEIQPSPHEAGKAHGI